MIEQFYSLETVSLGVLKVVILIAIGSALNAAKVLKKDGIDAFSNVILWVCLPALMLTKITSKFLPSAFPGWWAFPLASVGMSALGLVIGYAFQKPFKDFGARREFMTSCAFQNCGYLPMTLVAFICTGDFCDRMLIYIFLFITGFNLTAWTFIPAFLSKGFIKNLKPASLMNPPLVATVFSIVSVFILGNDWVPGIVGDPLGMLGGATFPLVLLVLGAYLSERSGHIPKHIPALAACLFAKLIVLPLVTLLILNRTALDITYKLFILIEASMPSAVSLVIIGYYKKADNRFYSGMIFYSHLLAAITVPFWLYVFKVTI